MSKTIEELKKYVPYNEQEQIDKDYFIHCEEVFGDILNRTNLHCHLTSSAFVVNKERTKGLFLYHNLFDSWTFSGGHADGDDDMIYVAKKELKEETSLKNFKLLSSNPISIDSIGVQSHFKKGKFVPSHVHLNFTYLFVADENEAIKVLESENSNVGWLTFEELYKLSKEPLMIKIFKKIVEKLQNLKEN